MFQKVKAHMLRGVLLFVPCAWRPLNFCFAAAGAELQEEYPMPACLPPPTPLTPTVGACPEPGSPAPIPSTSPSRGGEKGKDQSIKSLQSPLKYPG